MARNGSGVYSLPAGYEATSGNTATASQHNTPLEDLETDMNTARPVVAGGTGASTAANARTNLGLAIGTDVQAYHANLTTLASATAAGLALMDDADASAQRTTLGLGTAATSNTGDFATAAQGSTADSALQNISEDTTPQLGGDLDANGHAVFWSKGADVASAAELLVLTDGNSFDVTGTTTITSIETTADAFGIGSIIMLQFDGTLTLTHHATDLVLPGAANITTAAGDIALFQKYAAGDWRCVSYQVAANAPGGGGGGFEFISSTDISSAASYDFAAFDSASYDVYMFVLQDIRPASDAKYLWVRTSTDGGSTFDSGASDYTYRVNSTGGAASGTTTKIVVNDGALADAIGNTASDMGFCGTVLLYAPHQAANTVVTVTGAFGSYQTNDSIRMTDAVGMRLSAADVDGIQFLFNSGNIASGTVTAYGMKNA